MHILLFGGSFNPPHLGHTIVIEQAFELVPQLDELWILPTFNHAFGKNSAPAADRLAMCQLLVEDLRERQSSALSGAELVKRASAAGRLQAAEHARLQARTIKVCTYEIDNQSTGSTYQTLQSLKALYPQHSFSFLMGSDQLPKFDQWDDYQQLLEEMPFYVYPRGSHRHDIVFPHMTLLESPTQIITNISSTLVRDRLSQHQSVSHILSPTIANYLRDHHLYE
jgi:nicotinate-nucleotide adenylyltransferase